MRDPRSIQVHLRKVHKTNRELYKTRYPDVVEERTFYKDLEDGIDEEDEREDTDFIEQNDKSTEKDTEEIEPPTNDTEDDDGSSCSTRRTVVTPVFVDDADTPSVREKAKTAVVQKVNKAKKRRASGDGESGNNNPYKKMYCGRSRSAQDSHDDAGFNPEVQ